MVRVRDRVRVRVRVRLRVLHEGPLVVCRGPDDGLAFLGLHGEAQVELGAAALLARVRVMV